MKDRNQTCLVFSLQNNAIGCLAALGTLFVFATATGLSAHEPPAGCSTFLESWDPLAAGAGLDLAACGAALVADTGSFEAEHGVVTLTPGASDQLGLGNTIAIAATAAGAPQGVPSGSYRVRFDFAAHGGLEQIAFFGRARYAFDSETGAIDASTFGALGVNFSVDGRAHDAASDHLHADVRGACLSEGVVTGAKQVDYPGFLMTSEDFWSVAMDLDGDAESGPLRLAIKMYPAGTAEPSLPFAVFTLEGGFGLLAGGVTEHALFVAALGAGTLEILEASLCEVPGEERRVQALTCERGAEELVHLTWENPPTGDPAAEIKILVGEVEEVSLPGTATEYLTTRPIEGEVTLSVINSSGFATTCLLEGEGPEAHFLRSDCNGEGNVDLSDAVFSLNYLFTGGATPGCLDACDSNADLLLDLSDAVHTLTFLFLGGAAPAEPFPACGHGPAPVGCTTEQCPH